jgi:pimeloyl-ACP methyl ester carboxylesterase
VVTLIDQVERGRPVVLGHGSGAMAGMLALPDGPGRDVAVLLCPPFGWDAMCAHRHLGDWGAALARAGFPALRFDLPGTGDSAGGPHDPERLAAWTAAVTDAAQWLRERTGCTRVAAVGIGLGGLLAVRAASDGAPIDDLALWGVPARGRRFVRELKAFARLETPGTPPDGIDGDPDDGAMTVAGYVLSPATMADLSAVELAELALPSGRALLLERDGRAPDEALSAALAAAGATVATAPGPGYERMMMLEPQDSRPAWATFDAIRAWLEEAPGADTAPAAAPATSDADRPVLALDVDGAAIRETPLLIEHVFGAPVAIVAQPADAGAAADLCLVLLNAGPQRHIGPNRMWVEQARRWAARGVPSARVDLAGIGDADGEGGRFDDTLTFYDPAYTEQVGRVLDALIEQGVGRRFLVLGLCGGGWWAQEALQADDRVVCALGINTGALLFDGGWGRTAFEARVMVRKALAPRTWLRVLGGKTSFHVHIRTLRRLARGVLLAPVRALRRRPGRDDPEAPPPDPLDDLFDRLAAADKRLDLIFAGEEPLHATMVAEGRLERMGRWPGVTVCHVPVAGNVHTLRPRWLQREVHAFMDATIEREVRAAAGAPAPAAG